MQHTYVWYYEILLRVVSIAKQCRHCKEFTDLDVHEVVGVDPSEFRKLLPTLFQKSRDIIALLALRTK